MMAIATNKLNKRIALNGTGGVGDSACPGTAYGHLATDCVLFEASWALTSEKGGARDSACPRTDCVLCRSCSCRPAAGVEDSGSWPRDSGSWTCGRDCGGDVHALFCQFWPA